MKKYILSLLLLSAYANSIELSKDYNDYINTLKIEAKQENPTFVDFDKDRGEKIFTTQMFNQKANTQISCVTCHKDLKSEGNNIFTNKTITPLSPSVNKDRFIDLKETKKWLKRNFNDVYGKEGTAMQKGDVLYYILSK